MLFNSGQFIIFFPIVVLFYYILPTRVRNLWLLFSSYFFYMCWNVRYSVLLFSSTLITYIGAIILEKHRSRLVAALVVIANLSILFYFKYINFALSVISDFAERVGIHINTPVFDIILPVGISFYIFQALGYLIDVYRGDVCAEHDPLRYALFVSFFPQLVAGPIERSGNLLRQFSHPQPFLLDNVQNGVLTMLWGYFLKLVIADRCAILVDHIYSSYMDFSGIQLILANVLFALQIYCDFMGYSTIAKGGAKILGINLMDNFRQPYLATSIKDFWRRWHISLSSWFRDYLYIPLGGSRCTAKRKYLNILITFFVSGLWHGASFTFIAWGLIHGLYQVIEDITTPFFDKLTKRFKIQKELFSWKVLLSAKTFLLADIAWVFFRAETIHSALYILRSSFDISNWGILLTDNIYYLGLNTRNMNILFFSLIPLLISSFMKEKGMNVKKWILDQNILFRYVLYWSAIMLIILSLDITGQEFIYFQF